jgi:periplasmic protein TonB
MGYEQSVSSQKKLIGFVLVLLLHIVLIYALINGMAQEFIKKIANDPLEVNIIAEVKLPPPPPPPPPKQEEAKPKEVKPLPAYVPPVEVKVQASTSQETITAVASNEPPKSEPVAQPTPEPVVEAKAEPKPEPAPEPPPPPPPPKPKERTKASTKPGCTKPPYPAESQELEEEGTVTLGITTDVDGNVVDIKIIKSSGFGRLDDAAKQAFGRCEFNPGTVDGVPEKTTATVQYEFRL